ncbi:MAG: hypothetical protein AB2819_17710, partial [Candidatus Thiodiazotropha endolucinida]
MGHEFITDPKNTMLTKDSIQTVTVTHLLPGHDIKWSQTVDCDQQYKVSNTMKKQSYFLMMIFFTTLLLISGSAF